MSRRVVFACAVGAVIAAGCASDGPAPDRAPLRVESGVVAAPPRVPAGTGTASLPRYRCDHDIIFTVRFADGEADIDAGAHGSERLMRDAGGLTPAQAVYSSTHLKAEFGLGADGRGAKLNYASPPVVAQCIRE